MHVRIYVDLYIFATTCISTGSHADICPWVIYLLIFEMPCSNFATLTALSVISENESSVSLWFQHIHVYVQWYLQHFLLFIIRGSCSLKSSFVSCSFFLAWLPKLPRHTKPETYDISFFLLPPPGLSLTWREAGNVFSRLCHQRSTHCVPEYVNSAPEVPRTC